MGTVDDIIYDRLFLISCLTIQHFLCAATTMMILRQATDMIFMLNDAGGLVLWCMFIQSGAQMNASGAACSSTLSFLLAICAGNTRRDVALLISSIYAYLNILYHKPL